MRRLFATLPALLAVLAASAAEAAIITPTDILRITFSINPGGFGGSTPDLLAPAFDCCGGPGSGATWNGVAGYTAELFDGGASLGTYEAFDSSPNLAVVPMFRSATSLYTFRNPTIVDFSSILDGTIDGRIDMRIKSGTLAFDNVDGVLWESFDEAGATADFGWTAVSFQVLPVPEPASLSLAVAAICGCLIARRRRGV